MSMSSGFMSITEMRGQIDGLTSSLEMLDRQTHRTISTMQQAFYLAKQMGLPPHIERAIDATNKMIITLNALRAAYYAVTAARMAAGDPLAWAGAIIAVGGAIVSLGIIAQPMETERRGREW